MANSLVRCEVTDLPVHLPVFGTADVHITYRVKAPEHFRNTLENFANWKDGCLD